MAANSLAQARSLAAEGYIRWICEYDLCNGPQPAVVYLENEDFVPTEPAWLRTKLSQQLPGRLSALWSEEQSA